MRILQVVFYDLDKPMHGGQIRCQQINKKLQEMGFRVTLLTIFGWSGGHTSLGPQINVSDEHQVAELAELSQEFTYAGYDSYLLSTEGSRKLLETVDVDAFDVVWEDHPYIHHSLRAHFSNREAGQPLYVYSSQNVESELVKELLYKHDGPTHLKTKVAKAVSDLERQAVKDANIILAVTESDLNTFKSFGTGAKLVHVPNASRPLPERVPSSGNFITGDLALSRYALFIGSGHPPNARGFLEMMGDSLEYLHPGFQIVCVGGVSWGIWQHLNSLSDPLLPLSRLTLLVDASNDEIDHLRLGASVILLPILEGGGSNLKTAEALLSPARILATSKSFRGFEPYSRSAGVHIADSPKAFQASLARLSRADEEKPSYERNQISSHPLTWDNALFAIEELL
jgi:hypothetical protein